jgi:ribonuclease R
MTKKPHKMNPLLEALKSYLSRPDYIPTSRTALFKELKISGKQQEMAKNFIEDMILEKEILIKASKIYYQGPQKHVPLIKGTLRMHPRGFGFVVPENRAIYPEDFFIAKHMTKTAVDGDLVEIKALPPSKKDKGPEGEVICILERSRSHLAGIVQQVSPTGEISLFSPLLGIHRQIRAEKFSHPLRYGDRVIVKILDWGTQNKPIFCEITHHFGHISQASIDVTAAAEEFSLQKEFPPEVLEEVKKYSTTVSMHECHNRLDLTQEEAFTIDPTTAKDFDDALSLTKDNKGHYHLGVHIADVAHYVKPQSALDEEALRRCNSTYFPGTCLPMLPEELSNHLCSLKPKVIRLCVSVLMTFDAKGTLLKHEIRRSAIKSTCRKHLPTLQLMVELCLLLKQKRYERGSIDFALAEVVLDIDPEGTPTSYHIVEYDITHQLVEEFMLKANEVTAKALSSQGLPVIFRIHEKPNEENIEDFFALARSLGFFVPAKPDSKDIQKLFEQAKTTTFAQQLSIGFIRSMKLASYSPENVGHFGLSLEEYCHFTSPIRRYPDLIIQRLLFNELPPHYDLEKIAQLCSEKERISFKAEQTVKTLKKLRLLKAWHTEDPNRKYTGFISKIKPYGLHFELSPLSVEGFLHVSALGWDYFVYEEGRNALVGRNSSTQFCVGDPIEVRLRSVDLVLLEAHWEKPNPPSSLQTTSKGPKKKSNKKRKRGKNR